MLRTRLIAGTTATLVLSAVFATVVSLVHVADAAIEPLRVVPGTPAPVTLRLPEQRHVESPDGTTKTRTAERLIVPRASLVAPRDAFAVQAFEQSRRPVRSGYALGMWFVYFLIALMMTTSLRRLSPGRGVLLRTQVGLLGLIAFLVAAAKVYLLLTPLSEVAIPVAAMPLWVALFFDRRGAITAAMALSFLTASLVGFNLVALAVFLAMSVTALMAFRDMKHPASMLWAGCAAAVAAPVALVAARLMHGGSFDVAADLGNGPRSELLAATAGGLLSGGVAYLLQGLAVLMFGAVSRARLQDLTDVDQPLLQKIAAEAPGTWEHSRAMANLAEEAAAAIGADALLTRVGAYYHDIGKSRQPKYYVENLAPEEPSPHDELDPDISADAIMAHVVEGTQMLRRAAVPEPVVEFVYTHHGTGLVEFFWHKCLQGGNPKNLPESFFCYPGMRPRTKETAILMLVDGIEAAARTLSPPTTERFDELVQRIVFVKLRQGQLDESGLSMVELRVLGTRLSEVLRSVYHGRIRYPWQEQGTEPAESGTVSAVGVVSGGDSESITMRRSPSSRPPPQPAASRVSYPPPAPPPRLPSEEP